MTMRFPSSSEVAFLFGKRKTFGWWLYGRRNVITGAHVSPNRRSSQTLALQERAHDEEAKTADSQPTGEK